MRPPPTADKETSVKDFLDALRLQRWDDHRYYHHSRINQSLHFVSAAQLPRRLRHALHQPGHGRGHRLAGVDGHAPVRPLLLRAQGYDHVNQATPRAQGGDQGRLQPAAQGRADRHLGAGAAARCSSIRTLLGVFEPAADRAALLEQVGLIWLFVGVGGLLFRTVHLFFIRDVQHRAGVDDQDPHGPLPRHQALRTAPPCTCCAAN